MKAYHKGYQQSVLDQIGRRHGGAELLHKTPVPSSRTPQDLETLVKNTCAYEHGIQHGSNSMYRLAPTRPLRFPRQFKQVYVPRYPSYTHKPEPAVRIAHLTAACMSLTTLPLIRFLSASGIDEGPVITRAAAHRPPQ